MRLGLALPQYDESIAGLPRVPWPTVVAWAQAAERLGFDSVWLADHLTMSFEKYGAPAGEHEGFEPVTTLSALARVTTGVRLGTLVLCAQLRPATVLAKMLATLDALSGGRLEVGVGAGWHPPDYAAADVPFHRPGVRLRELAATLEALRASFAGDGPPLSPRPIGRPTLWAGGRGDRLLAVVAAHADGWNTVWRMTPADYRARLDVLERACEAVGRDPATVQRSLGLYTLVGEDERDLRRRWERLVSLTPPGVLDGMDLERWSTGALVGTVEQAQEQLAAWSELGVTTVITCLGAVPFAATDPDDLELVASAVP